MNEISVWRTFHMHWVIQTNVYAEEGFEALLAAVKRFDLPLTLVKVIPFSGELEAIEGTLPEDGANAIVMGSYTLARVAKQKNWVPGAFLKNLDFEIQRQHWGRKMLNHDAVICKFDEVADLDLVSKGWTEEEARSPFFFRPVHDTKAFTGYVIDMPEYIKWRDSLRHLPETIDPENDPLGVNLLTLDTKVMVCRKKVIYNETRFWIVKGRPVTCSGYKMGTIKRYTRPEEVDQHLEWFAAHCADLYQPDEAFVLDVATTPQGETICEVNNLNSAGWYRSDLQKLVDRLNFLFTKREQLVPRRY